MDFQPETTINLCATKLILGNGNQILFDTIDEQTQYFLSTVKKTYDEQTYQRVGLGRVSIEVNAEELSNGVNYLMFRNGNYSNKWYYANIIRIHYINPNTTYVDYALDSFQTFMFDIDLTNKTYVDRRTYSISDGFDTIMQLPYEDLDVGGTYNIYDETFRNFITDATDVKSDDFENLVNVNRDMYYLIITTQSFLSGTATPFFYTQMITGRKKANIFNADTVSAITGMLYDSLHYYLVNANAMEELIVYNVLTSTRMNGSIMSIQLLPFGDELLQLSSENVDSNIINKMHNDYPLMPSNYNNFDFRINYIGSATRVNISDTKILYLKMTHVILDKYLKSVIEDKKIEDISDNSKTETMVTSAIQAYFYRYPYSLFEVSDFGSNIITYKINELMNGNPLKLLNDLPNASNKRLPVSVYYSLGSTVQLGWDLVGNKNVENFELAEDLSYAYLTENVNPLRYYTYNFVTNCFAIPVISDYTSAFFQANQNQLQAIRTNASATLNNSIQNANASKNAQASANQLAYKNSQIGADTSLANSNINAGTNLANAGLSYNNAQFNAGMSGMSNALNLNPVGSFTSAFQGMVNANNNYQMTANSVSAMQSTNLNSANAMMLQAGNSLMASQGIMNANYANSMRNANLNYFTTINSLNARLEDIKNIPDSVQTPGAGAFTFPLLNRLGLTLKSKALPRKILKRLIGYFTLYGFKSNTFESLKDATASYEVGGFIRTVNANITGQIPQENLREIIDLFDAGVFIWKGADNYMNYEGVKKQ